MTEPNIPLLRKGVEWVEEQAALPLTNRRWYQGSYVVPWKRWLRNELLPGAYLDAVYGRGLDCGTACCFAGYIAQECEPGFTSADVEWQNDHARDVAIKHLGITNIQANDLFNGDNGPEMIRRAAEDIAGEPL